MSGDHGAPAPGPVDHRMGMPIDRQSRIIRRNRLRAVLLDWAAQDRERVPYGRLARGAWTAGVLFGLVYALMMQAGGGPVDGRPVGRYSWILLLVAAAAFFCGASLVLRRWKESHRSVGVQGTEITKVNGAVVRSRPAVWIDPRLMLALILGSLPIGLGYLPYCTVMAVLEPFKAAARRRERAAVKQQIRAGAYDGYPAPRVPWMAGMPAFWPAVLIVVSLLACVVAAAITVDGGDIGFSAAARLGAGRLFAGAGAAATVVAIVLAVILVGLMMRPGWLGASVLVLASVLIRMITVTEVDPGLTVLGAVVAALIGLAAATWMVMTWRDWVVPAVPAGYGAGVVGVATSVVLVLTRQHTGDHAALRVVVVVALAVAVLGLAARRVLAGPTRETPANDWLFGILAAVLISWSALSRPDAGHVAIFLGSLLAAWFLVYAVEQFPRWVMGRIEAEQRRRQRA